MTNKLNAVQQMHIDRLDYHAHEDRWWYEYFFTHGFRTLAQVEEQMEYLDQSFDGNHNSYEVLKYLITDGSVDWVHALEQTANIRGFDDWDTFIQEYFDIPDRLWGLIDKEFAEVRIRMEVSIFEVNGRYYIQES